ncbi:hypothetical protein [Kumtagia ephedrae]|jgi:hypothetical protein|uniref:Uncharacterized protein n=1 Tax=Kumtagia ephedrae TaxID=2116701 RepID=A0A2P7SF04_9HYPH|nr:hypothetical protein [Mesorhizobium ephedrae]PSJ61063.1 hypothetical protein C7I84_10175 [Mesorhizobium ephedrae]
MVIRLVIAGAAFYAAYRIGKEFLNAVPSDFEPVPEAPRRPARAGSNGRKPAAKRRTAPRAASRSARTS